MSQETDNVSRPASIRGSKAVNLTGYFRHFFSSGPGMPILYFGSGAACFGAGIILLANHLEPQDMGMVALFLVLLRLGPALGTIGLDVLLMRARPSRDVLPFNAIAASSVAVSLLVVSLATVVYDLSLNLAVALSAGLIAASYWRMFVVLNQSRERKHEALRHSQLPEFIAFFLGLIAMHESFRSATILCGLASTGYFIGALMGWRSSHARNWQPSDGTRDDWRITDRLSIAGLTCAALLIVQIERFIIPKVLSFEDLALYAAVASLAVAPLKLITAASKFYLIPVVVSAKQNQTLSRVVFHQCLAIGTAAILACGAVAIISPWLWDRILPADYSVELGLVVAILVTGLVRLWSGVTTTLLNAVGQSSTLLWSNLSTWGCLLLLVTISVVIPQPSLVGFIWILTIGFGMNAAAITGLTIVAIRRSAQS